VVFSQGKLQALKYGLRRATKSSTAPLTRRSKRTYYSWAKRCFRYRYNTFCPFHNTPLYMGVKNWKYKMSGISRTERIAREAFLKENELFRAGKALWEADCWKDIYEQIQSYGIELEKSVLINIIPDDVTALSGGIIRQDGAYCYFWLDFDKNELSEWEEVECSDSTYKPPQHTKERPWDASVLAKELFLELRNIGGGI